MKTSYQLFAIICFLFFSLLSMAQTTASKSTFYVIRLKPHQDLKKELMAFATIQRLKAGFIVTCVGSLEQTSLRFANQTEGKMQKGHFEILSLVGTFSDSSAHLHLSVADSTGTCMGGHLLDENLVYTTAEIVIGELNDIKFEREVDATYGYKELTIKNREK